MAKPWERYQKTESVKPWERYGQPAQQSEQQEPEQQEPSVMQQLGRQAGLTGRAVVEGVGDIADIVGAPVSAMTGLRKPSAIASDLATNLGMPEAETRPERFVQNVSKPLVGAAGIIKAGQVLSKVPGVVGKFGGFLAENPVGQGAAALGAGVGGEVGRDMGLEGYAALAPAMMGAAAAQGIVSGAQRVPSFIKSFGKKGYVIPPSQSKSPTAISRGMETLSGKAKTEQLASVKNQAITNQSVLDDLKMPKDTQLSPEMLKSYRSAMYDEGYLPIAKSGTVNPDAKLQADLIGIVKQHRKTLQDFPDSPVAKRVYEEVRNLYDAARKPFNPDTALTKVRELRELATKAYKADETSLGKAYRDMAESIESQLGRHLSRTGAPPETVTAFKNARRNIAKAHTIEESMVGSAETGYNINARKLNQLRQGGTPLEGGMKRAADYAASYPKSMTLPVAGATNPYTTTDLFTGGINTGMGATLASLLNVDPLVGAAIGIGGTLLRPVGREAMLSQPWQRALMQSSQPSRLGNLLYPAMAIQEE